MKYIFVSILLLSSAAVAAETPNCNSNNLGKVTCMANRMCECKYQRAGNITGQSGRYSWDCGILRPSCLDNNIIDGNNPYNGPDAVGIDKSTTTINN